MPLPCERKTLEGWIAAAKVNLEACTAIELAGWDGSADPETQIEDLMVNVTTAAYKLEKALQLIAMQVTA